MLFFTYICNIMAFIIQSISDPTKYWTGTTIRTRRNSYPAWAMFDTDINKARQFDTRDDASDHADTIEVPTTIIEV